MFEVVKGHREKNSPSASVSMDTSKPEPEVKTPYRQIIDKRDRMCNISINRTFLETHRQEKQCCEFPEKMHLPDRFIQSEH